MEDILTKQSKITEEDIKALKGAFEKNPALIVALRKIFYPELTADAPILMNNDMFSNIPTSDLSVEQMAVKFQARQMLVQHVEASLNVVRTLIGRESETPEQILARLAKDSAK